MLYYVKIKKRINHETHHLKPRNLSQAGTYQRGSQWSFLLHVGSIELHEALQVKVQCVGSTFSVTSTET